MSTSRHRLPNTTEHRSQSQLQLPPSLDVTTRSSLCFDSQTEPLPVAPFQEHPEDIA